MFSGQAALLKANLNLAASLAARSLLASPWAVDRDVRFGSFSTKMVKADACTCPLRPESDRQPFGERLTLRAISRHAVVALALPKK